MIRDRAEHFWRRLDKNGPIPAHRPELGACWVWTGARVSKGYGNLRIADQAVAAHRFAWELANGPIPDGLCICHHCDNPPCCNPRHLFLGTNRDNALDMSAKGQSANQRKTHCVNGHPFTAENTYVLRRPGKPPARQCLTCKGERSAAQYRAERDRDVEASRKKNREASRLWRSRHDSDADREKRREYKRRWDAARKQVAA